VFGGFSMPGRLLRPAVPQCLPLWCGRVRPWEISPAIRGGICPAARFGWRVDGFAIRRRRWQRRQHDGMRWMAWARPDRHWRAARLVRRQHDRVGWEAGSLRRIRRPSRQALVRVRRRYSTPVAGRRPSRCDRMRRIPWSRPDARGRPAGCDRMRRVPRAWPDARRLPSDRVSWFAAAVSQWGDHRKKWSGHYALLLFG
jgi:hypothetical protein